MKIIPVCLLFLVFTCSNSENQVKLETENPENFIHVNFHETNSDFSTIEFTISNDAEISYYSTVVTIVEFRDDEKKIGSERIVLFPQPPFGPGSTYVHKSKLHSAPGTKEILVHIDRATIYPEKELKALKLD